MGPERTANYVALDLGAGSGRAMLGCFDGERLTLQTAHRFPNAPVTLSGELYWDALRLWGDLKEGTTRAAAMVGGALDGLAVDTWGVDYAWLDRAGRLLANPRHYRDPRTDGMLGKAFKRMPREHIFASTGIQFMPINTIYQLLSQVIALDPVLSAAERLVMMPDLFSYWFSGRITAERTMASTSQCYNPVLGEWAVDVLQAMGIARHLLPEIIDPGTVHAPMRADLAAELRLPRIPVIAVGSHDTASAVAAVPLEGANEAYLSSGTWSLLGVETAAPVINEETLRHNFTNEVGVEGTVRLLKNITGLWIIQEMRRGWVNDGAEISYDEMAVLAQQAKPFAHFIDPNDPVFMPHGDMPGRVIEYCRRTRQPVPAHQGAMIRTAFESLVFTYRSVTDLIEQITGQEIGTIHLVGGGTRNSFLNQWTANATGRRVRTGPAEATAAGNILMQLRATGRLGSLTEGRALIRTSFPSTIFDPEDTARWNAAYEQFKTKTTHNL